MPNPIATANVTRRTWDKEKYEQRVKDREEFGDEYVDGVKEAGPVRDKQEFRAAEAGAQGPAGSKRSWLKHREGATFDFEQRAGTSRILTEPEIQKKAQGWYCDVCECLLRDSTSYLDHVNGKKHQRKLGFSMRVERVGVEAVSERFQVIKDRKARQEELDKRASSMDAQASYQAQLEQSQQAEEAERQRKREAKRQKKDEAARADQAAEEEEEDYDAEMNAMMGFGGFGGAKKKKR